MALPTVAARREGRRERERERERERTETSRQGFMTARCPVR